MEHMFFQCSKAKLIWVRAPIRGDDIMQSDLDFKEWWETLCTLGRQKIYQDRIELLVHILWGIWKMRNELLFQNNHIPVMQVVERATQE